MSHGNEMICQPVTLSGYAEWPKVADAVIEAHNLLYQSNDAVLTVTYPFQLQRRPTSRSLHTCGSELPTGFVNASRWRTLPLLASLFAPTFSTPP
jgi:hypothetical protein